MISLVVRWLYLISVSHSSDCSFKQFKDLTQKYYCDSLLYFQNKGTNWKGSRGDRDHRLTFDISDRRKTYKVKFNVARPYIASSRFLFSTNMNVMWPLVPVVYVKVLRWEVTVQTSGSWCLTGLAAGLSVVPVGTQLHLQDQGTVGCWFVLTGVVYC